MREDTLVCRDVDPLFGPFFIKSSKAYTLHSISSACSRHAHAVGRRVSLGPQLTPQTPIRSALPPHAGGTEEGGSMVYVSARALEEELRHLEEELAAARNLEHSTAERHAEEGSQETETVLEARKIQAEHLEAEREGLVAELRRRAVAEAGWEHDDAPVRSAGCGRAGKLRIGPHLLLPERGYLLHDRSEGTVAWVRGVPSPSRASELLAEHGVEWEGELLSHTLAPVPEGAERP